MRRGPRRRPPALRAHGSGCDANEPPEPVSARHLRAADLLNTDGRPERFDEPFRARVRILQKMVEVRPVLANDDGVRTVYAAHGPELYRFALRSLGDRGLAEEAVQETFVRAWPGGD